MKPFLAQTLLLIALACLVPVLCQDASSIQRGLTTVTDGVATAHATKEAVIQTVKDLANATRWSLGAVLVVVGLLFLVIGKFLIRAIFALTGGCLLGGVSFYIGHVIEGRQSPSTGLIIGVVVMVVVGVMLGFFLLKLGTVLLGALAGVCLTMLIARMKLFESTPAWIIGAILVIGLCVLAYFLSSIILIALTSIIGSFSFMNGVDFYIEKGFSDFVVGFDLKNLAAPNQDVVIMLVSTAILAALGFLVQYCVCGRK